MVGGGLVRVCCAFPVGQILNREEQGVIGLPFVAGFGTGRQVFRKKDGTSNGISVSVALTFVVTFQENAVL